MIALLALFLQAATVVPPTLVVRIGGQEASVALYKNGKRQTVSAAKLAAAMGGELTALGKGRYAFTVGEARLEFTTGVPFVKTDSGAVPIASAPILVGSTLYVPFSVVSNIIPRFVTGFLYDDDKGELRGFSTAARRGTTAAERRATAAAVAARERDDSASPSDDDSAVAPPPPSTPASDPAPAHTTRRKKRLVVVDAGHGGPDNGMHGPIGGSYTIYEKNITLAVAKMVAQELRSRGIDVLMTRTTDTLIALADRGKIANAAHGDVFVSVHVNATGSRGKDGRLDRGYETYFLAEAKTEDARRVERMENEAVKFETGINAAKGDPLSFIINDMAQNEHLRESNELAQLIQNGFKTFHPGPNRGVQQANFAVLRGSFMPAVLVEIGFGTNISEAGFIKDPDNERTIARSIAASVDAYLDRYDARVGGRQ